MRRWWTYKRWWIAVLLLVITAVGYLDRQALSFAAKPIRDEFGLDNEDYGLITGAFLATYALGQVLSGPLIDRFGTRLEQRFTRAEITAMMEAAGLERIRFNEEEAFWTAVGWKAGRAPVDRS